MTDVLEPQTFRVTRADLIRYAGASGDFNPIHWSERFATGVGLPVVYLGSKTGRDGIHGATMASAAFDDSSEEKRPTVQVGDPFAEKLLLEACLELMQSGSVIAIQDMGAAGLTCSAVEMGAKGDLGPRRKRLFQRGRPGLGDRQQHESRLDEDQHDAPGVRGSPARLSAGGRRAST